MCVEAARDGGDGGNHCPPRHTGFILPGPRGEVMQPHCSRRATLDNSPCKVLVIVLLLCRGPEARGGGGRGGLRPALGGRQQESSLKGSAGICRRRPAW